MTPPALSWHLGLDLGQRRDHSALATLSCEESRLVIRDIERFPLGTSYLFYSEAIRERLHHIGALAAVLTVDAGGPGAPVVENLDRANLGIEIDPIVITSGRQAGRGTVPRKMLLGNLIRLIDCKRLVTHKALENWPILVAEMLDLNASTSHPNKTSNHDDMVIALALAAWQATRRDVELHPRRQPSPNRWNPASTLF